ncbi:uncharacterized protein LOC62_04G005295 [Vanrija pseudolonga]|uniref:Zn(2)-C6 fungal-type domain-containing protein n=1 Tax=Vanrija pseudolonga TaxID=143232 RepID=A0AAF0YDF4_9TREE|nr:hypothetical protein LOC62_04G005295 [Vanrija pseudolonga]
MPPPHQPLASASGSGSSSASPVPPTAPRRSIARRSCQLCRQRKARCELPDETVPDSPVPLAQELKCHRCKVLREDCVVLSAGRAGTSKKRKADDAPTNDATPPVRAQQPAPPAGADEEHTIMSTFEPGRPTQPVGKSSLRYHSRPLTLTTEMLRLAFAPEATSATDAWPISVEVVQDAYHQLLLIHPALPALSPPTATASISERLLQRLMWYVCGLHTPSFPTSTLQTLAEDIPRLRDDVLRRLPTSLDTVLALQLFGIFVPLGVLPGQAVIEARSVGKNDMVHVAASHVLRRLQAADTPSVTAYNLAWTALLDTKLRISTELDSDRPAAPDDLGTAITSARNLVSVPGQAWAAHLASDDATSRARAVGQLALCDRIIRDGQVLQTMQAMYSAIDQMAHGTITPSNVVAIGAQQLSGATEAREATEDLLNTSLSMYSLDPTDPLVRPWLTCRAIHSAHRDGKIQRTALRLLMATHYLPRDTSVENAERVRQALQRSYHTPDVLAFFTADPSPAGFDLIPSLSTSRMASLEAILGSFQRLLPTDLQPWHELWAMAVDGTSVFKEMQAGSIMLVGPMNGEKGERALRQKSRIHEWGGAKAGLLAVADILLQGEAGVVPVPPGAKTIGTMCDKLVRSMIKVMDERQFDDDPSGRQGLHVEHPRLLGGK